MRSIARGEIGAGAIPAGELYRLWRCVAAHRGECRKDPHNRGCWPILMPSS